MAKTKRIVVDIDEEVAINFRIAALKRRKTIARGVEEALKKWAEKEVLIDKAEFVEVD